MRILVKGDEIYEQKNRGRKKGIKILEVHLQKPRCLCMTSEKVGTAEEGGERQKN